MLNIMELARLVNPCFKITVLEISGRPIVRLNFLDLYEHLSSVLKCVDFSNGQPRIHQGNQIHGFGCPAFEIGTVWIFYFYFEHCKKICYRKENLGSNSLQKSILSKGVNSERLKARNS